ILLAVLPASEHADKVGGTARIVACRRSGRPDPVAAAVFEASEVLAPRDPLLRPPSGYVWLIDPVAKPLCDKPPVTGLPPAPDNTPYRIVYERPCGLGAEEDAGAQRPGHQDGLGQAEHLHESQRVLRIAGDYRLHRKPGGKADTTEPSSRTAWP